MTKILTIEVPELNKKELEQALSEIMYNYSIYCISDKENSFSNQSVCEHLFVLNQIKKGTNQNNH